MKDSLAPQQDRSVRTQRMLLDGFERLLRKQSFDSVTVAQIAAEAGLTTGAIYRRFKDKRALLHASFERFVVRSRELQPDRLAATAAMGDRERVEYMIRSTVKFTIPYLSLMRAASAMNDATSFELMLEARNQSADWLATQIQSSSLDEQQLRRRTRFALRTVTAVIRDTMLAGPGVHRRGKFVDGMVDDLTEMTMGYLQIPE